MASNSFKVKNSLVLTPKDLSTLTSPEAGDLACDINDSNKIKRYDAASASWVEVGSGGGVGGVDIFFVQDFESASLSSFTQTGLVLSQTDPLKGKVSAVLTHQAAVNQSFKQVIPVDRKFRGQTMVLRLDAKSSASAGNLVIKITNETASTDLVTSEQLEISNDVNGAKSSVSFTIPESCASLSYTITALPQSGSPVSRIDDIICELASTALLETAVEVPVVTAWQGYTPTFQGFGTPTNVEFEWRQVGENVEIRGKFTSGTATAVEARVGLPAGLTSAGTSLIPSLQVVGHAARGILGSINTSWSVLVEPSVSYLTFSVYSNNTINPLTKQNASAMTGADPISFFASVPCAGLSATTTKTIPLTQSGLVQEADSRVYAAGNGGQAITVNVTDIPFTAISSEGNDISFNGSSVTALSNGIYSFDIGILFTTSLARRVSIYVNNAVIYETASATDTSLTSNITLKLNSGDIVKFRVSGNGGTLNNASQFHYLSVTKQSSLKQVSVNPNSKITIPTSELRMEGASTRGSTDTAIVRFDNVAKLRGDAFTVESDAVLGTRITMKKAGRLSVSASLFYGSSAYTRISRNQAIRTSLPVASEILAASGGITSPIGGASWTGDVNIGDIIRVSTDVSPSANAANSLNLSFQEQEIAVAVSNTLPQFSESDLVVRAAGNAGQSITANVTNIPFQTSFDSTGGAWNGSQFTVTESGLYSISTSVFFTTNINRSLELYVDGVSYRRIGLDTSLSYHVGAITDNFSAGQVLSIRTNGNGGTLNNNTSVHYLNITKVGKPNVTGVDVTPFVNVPQPEKQSLGWSRSVNSTTVEFNLGTVVESNGSGLFYVSGASLTALKECYVTSTFRIDGTATTAATGTGYTVTISTSTGLAGGGRVNNQAALALSHHATLSAHLLPGQTMSFNASATNVTTSTQRISIIAEALSDQILTAPETFSTDTASLQYASSSQYTLSTLQNAPVGTYITFTYAANTNTRTQTTTRPTQTDADMNVNGIQMFARAYNANSTAASPACVAIQIGKGLKGRQVTAYFSSAKTLPFQVPTERSFANSALTAENGAFQHYDENAGVLYIDAGLSLSIGNTGAALGVDAPNNTSRTSGYLVINASKNPALTGLGLGTVAVRGVNTAGTSIPNSGVVTINWDSAKTYDTHGALNTSTGVFTAPESGYYTASCGVYFATATYALANAIILYVLKNGVTICNGPVVYADRAASLDMTATVTTGVYLAKGDTLYFAVNNNRTAGATTLATANGANYLTIHKTSIGTGN